MKRIIAFQTILGWINSCKTLDQLSIATDVVAKIYDPNYRLENTEDSEDLYRAIINQCGKIHPAIIEPVNDANGH